MTDERSAGVGPGSLLVHPCMVGCLLLLIVNDHFLKARFHNAVTGKLSDLAGLAFVPVLLVAIVEFGCWVLRRNCPRQASAVACAGFAVAIGFAAVQTVPPATDAYRWLAGLAWSGQSSVVPDVTDLIALPAVAVGWILATAARRTGATSETEVLESRHA